MARKQYRPGSRLLVFFVGTAILFGLVALAGTWKPVLGLDLQGGTRITLIAEGSPKADSLDQARQIIDQRVNGSGVTEADVTTQGNRFITVEIPGETRRDLMNRVKGLIGGTDPTEGRLDQLARLDVVRLDAQVDGDLLPFYLQLSDQEPAVGEGDPQPADPPELSEGPHLSYAIQWFTFTGLTLVVYPLILRKKARDLEREAQLDGAGDGAGDDAADAAEEGAG